VQHSPVGDQKKSLTSNNLTSPVVDQQQTIQEEEASTVNAPPEKVHKTGVEANSKQEEVEEPQKYGEMDATTKWLLATSGLCTLEVIDSLSLL